MPARGDGMLSRGIRALRYEQMADELSGMIVGRILRPGERLPSVRRLSQEKKLSISTVLQALRELEERGQVEARPQSGFFICLPLLIRAWNSSRKPVTVWRAR